MRNRDRLLRTKNAKSYRLDQCLLSIVIVKKATWIESDPRNDRVCNNHMRVYFLELKIKKIVWL